MGDGFIVVPDFGDMELTRPLAIGTALLRASLTRGGCLKVGIGLGTLADVQGCYPGEVMKNFRNGAAPLGAGVMTIIPVMGDGLVGANKVSGRASGPLLITRPDLHDAVPPEGVPMIAHETYIEIDWIRADLAEADRILDTLNCIGDPATYASQLRLYVDANANKSLPEPW